MQIEWPYGVAIPHLGIYPKNSKLTCQKDIFISMFVVSHSACCWDMLHAAVEAKFRELTRLHLPYNVIISCWGRSWGMKPRMPEVGKSWGSQAPGHPLTPGIPHREVGNEKSMGLRLGRDWCSQTPGCPGTAGSLRVRNRVGAQKTGAGKMGNSGSSHWRLFLAWLQFFASPERLSMGYLSYSSVDKAFSMLPMVISMEETLHVYPYLLLTVHLGKWMHINSSEWTRD